MTVGTYHAALEKQHAMNLNTIGVTITGVDDMATNIPINSSTKNETTTLQDMIIITLRKQMEKDFSPESSRQSTQRMKDVIS